MSQRIIWLDSLKLLASILVLTTHFVVQFVPSFLHFWQEGGILRGITGKMAVCFFLVLAGCFAMDVKRENLWRYIVKRYIRFAVPVFFVETTVLLLVSLLDIWGGVEASPLMGNRYLMLENFNIQMFLSDVFLLEGDVVPTYWCNWYLFFAPVLIVAINGSFREHRKKFCALVIAIIIFFITEKIWFAIAFFGGILWLIIQKEYFALHKIYIRIMIGVLIVWLIRHGESPGELILKGIASIGVVLLVLYSKVLKKILENRVLEALSKYSYEVYLVHTPVHNLIIYFMFVMLKDMDILSGKVIAILMYILSLTATFFFAILLSKLCERMISGGISKKILYN